MSSAFVAVIGRVELDSCEFEGRPVEVTPLAPEVRAIMVPGCEDMLVHFRLAESLVTPTRPILVLTCIPDHKHQASWVLRAGRRAHAFLPFPADVQEGLPLREPRHFAGVHESWVEAPLAAGLALADLAEQVNAAEVCRRIGHHFHD